MKEWRRKCSDLIAEECLLDKLKEGAISLTATFYIKPPQYISKVKKKRAETIRRDNAHQQETGFR